MSNKSYDGNVEIYKENVVDYLSSAYSLDKDRVSDIYDNVANAEDDLASIISKTAKQAIPKYDHLTKDQAKDLLIAQMNVLRQRSNLRRLQRGVMITIPAFTSRHINQAVSMARAKGGFGDLLLAAGYREKR